MSNNQLADEKEDGFGEFSNGVADDASGLVFKSENDAIDFARAHVERVKRRFAPKSLDVAEQYGNGNIQLVLNFRSNPEAEKFSLIFSRVPSAESHLVGADHCAVDLERIANRSGQQRNDDLVCFDIPCGVETPKQRIASRVRLERFKERSDFRGDTKQFPVQLVVNCSASWSEWKLGFASDSTATLDGKAARVDGVAQSLAEIGQGALGLHGSLRRQGFCHADLVHLLACISIRLDHAGIWLRREEGFDSSIELLDMLPCFLE